MDGQEVEQEPLLTVKEVTQKLGISKQAIYQRLNADLSGFKVMVDGKIMLRASILDEFKGKQVDGTINSELTAALQQTIDLLKSQLLALNSQLEVKDIQIEQLNKHILEMDERLREAHVLIRDTQPPALPAPRDEPQPEESEAKKMPFWKRRKK